MTVTTLLMLGAVALVGVLLIDWATRRSIVGVSLVVVAIVLSHVFGVNPSVDIAGLGAQIPDLVWVVLLGAAVARWLRLPRLTGVHWAVVGLLVVVVVSVAQGVPEGELSVALVEARRYLFFFSAIAYGTTIELRWDVLDQAGYAWLVLAGVLGLYAALQLFGLAAGLTGGIFGDSSSMRVIQSNETLIVLQGGLIAGLAWRSRREPWLAAVAVGLLTLVVLLQHRSVWIAAIVAVSVFVVQDPRVAGRVAALVVVGLFVALGVFSLAFDQVDDDRVGRDLAASATHDSTWQWRVEGWNALLEQHAHEGAQEHLFGQAFGGGWDRTVRGTTVSVSPHNFYLEQYLRLGLLGLAAIVGLYVWAIKRLWRRTDRGRLLGPDVMLILAVTQLVYYVPYATSEQGMLLGLILAAAGAAQLKERRALVRIDA